MHLPCKLSVERSMRLEAAALLISFSLLLASCGGEKKIAAAPPPPDVEVVNVTPQDVPITKEWVAVLKGLVNSDVRSQVSGYLVKQTYANGAMVPKGAVLFEIDARPYQAALDQAKANLEQAVGAVQQAEAS